MINFAVESILRGGWAGNGSSEAKAFARGLHESAWGQRACGAKEVQP